jgi:hypothetical protein
MTAVALSCASVLPAYAGKPEPLDPEFLDYLSACEGKDDNWTVIADDKQRRKVAERSAPASPPPADKVAPKAEGKQ